MGSSREDAFAMGTSPVRGALATWCVCGEQSLSSPTLWGKVDSWSGPAWPVTPEGQPESPRLSGSLGGALLDPSQGSSFRVGCAWGGLTTAALTGSPFLTWQVSEGLLGCAEAEALRVLGKDPGAQAGAWAGQASSWLWKVPRHKCPLGFGAAVPLEALARPRPWQGCGWIPGPRVSPDTPPGGTVHVGPLEASRKAGLHGLQTARCHLLGPWGHDTGMPALSGLAGQQAWGHLGLKGDEGSWPCGTGGCLPPAEMQTHLCCLRVRRLPGHLCWGRIHRA